MERHTDHIDENAIRTKAHELWVQRGCPKESPQVDWDQAERLLRGEARQQPSAATRPNPDDEEVTTARRPGRA